MIEKIKEKKAYVVTVDMGYGHQRAVYPLKSIAQCVEGMSVPCGIINANNYGGIPKEDEGRWERSRKWYETISRMKRIPLLGSIVFGLMDYFQKIQPFYPFRDLSRPSIQVRQIFNLIHQGWGKDLIEKLNKHPLPFITSFFIPAFFAEEHGYKGEIYCICTDSDISRAWVPLYPQKTRIQYCVPTRRVKKRLMSYGVPQAQIFITGFPLPEENVGGDEAFTIVKKNLGCRISNLDPHGHYIKKYRDTLNKYLGPQYCNIDSGHPLTITYAVGGAGAQKEIGIHILKSLQAFIQKGTLQLNLVAGVRNDVYRYFEDEIKKLGLEKYMGDTLHIIYAKDKIDYFEKFNTTLLTTDILWTKPSELVFYSGLGIPIIMTPPVGSQEEFNRTWLYAIGAGFDQENVLYTHEWLFDWIKSGRLAEAAVTGFLDAPHNATYHIKRIVFEGKKRDIVDLHLL